MKGKEPGWIRRGAERLRKTIAAGLEEYGWRRRYHDYLTSAEWYAFREEALRRAARRCEWVARTGNRCSATKGLQVHHLHYRTLGHESLDDVQVLCVKHHQIADRRREEETERRRRKRSAL